MCLRKKKHRSGHIGVIAVEKVNGKMKELVTIGIARDESDVEELTIRGREWIELEQSRRHPRLDLFGEEQQACRMEIDAVERVLSNVCNILLNGSDLILDRIFDRVGFNRIEDTVFRQLVKARLSYPASKAATVEYLKNHFDEDVGIANRKSSSVCL